MNNYTFKPEDVNVESWSCHPQGSVQIGVEQGVLVRHLPTGISIVEDRERSQHQNRVVAFDKLDRILRCTRCEDGEIIDHLGDWAKCPDCK